MSNWQIVRLVLLILLFGGVSVSAYLFWEHELYFCVFFSFLLALLILSYLIYVYSRIFQRISRVMECLEIADFGVSFSTDGQGPMEQRLMESINLSMRKLRLRLSKREEKYQYIGTLLDTVDTSMMVVDHEGQVVWMNRASVKELCGHAIHRLDELKVLNSDLPMILDVLQPGEVKVVRIYKEDFMHDLAVTVTTYSNATADLRLINLKNIRSVLEENEMEAWQKLVRVLTHEIMNSITPIISLSDTLCERAIQQGMDEESLMLQGLKTIHRRSKGLMNFVENYRKLSRLSSPVLAPVSVGELLGDIKKLFSSSPVTYIYKIEDENRMLMIDRSQMEQVLINLLKNAGEACMEVANPEVVVETAYHKEKNIFQLSVTDNGCGILPEVQERIFIPFFTTKPTGSGIGLSLCKQIMALHGGSIRVASQEGKGSCFTLKWVVK